MNYQKITGLTNGFSLYTLLAQEYIKFEIFNIDSSVMERHII